MDFTSCAEITGYQVVSEIIDYVQYAVSPLETNNYEVVRWVNGDDSLLGCPSVVEVSNAVGSGCFDFVTDIGRTSYCGIGSAIFVGSAVCGSRVLGKEFKVII